MNLEVSTEDLASAIDSDVTVLDVREDFEFVERHVPNALHIPLGEVLDRIEEIDKARPVYVICAVGGRSLTVADALRQLGFDAASVAGGTNLWALEGRATASFPQ